MSIACKNDDAWLSGEVQTALDCNKCGRIGVIRGDTEREVTEALRKHANEKHGGFWRG